VNDAPAAGRTELERFFDLSSDLMVADVDGTFKRVNPAFERTLGVFAPRAAVASFLDIIHQRIGIRRSTYSTKFPGPRRWGRAVRDPLRPP